MFESAKIRLTVWYVAVLAFVLTAFAVLTCLLVSQTLQSRTNDTLTEIAAVFETTANREFTDEDKISDAESSDEAVGDAASELGFKDYQAFVFSADNRLIAQTKTADSDEQITPQNAESQLQKFSAGETSKFVDFETATDSFRVYHHSFYLQNQNYRLLVVHSLGDERETLERVFYVFLISVPLALLAASLGGYFLAKKSLSPISEMSRAAEAMTAKNLHERLPIVNERDEIGKLAATFNDLLSRLDASFEQQRRFMADASHELRTPVAIVRGEADVILGKEERGAAEYRESFLMVQSEAERMTRIIEDLFTLARVDAGQLPLQIHLIYLDEILYEAVKSFRTVAEKRRISLEFAMPEEMKFSGDSQLLRRLFSNLIENALKYAKSAVVVSARQTANSYSISFTDDGEGIAPEAQKRVFERFYRADKARSRDENFSGGSGAGLGLAISKFIAEAHYATLELADSNAGGSVFILKFPVSER